MDKKFTGKMHAVESSNVAAIGFQKGIGPNKEDVIRVQFVRGGIYDYYPATQQELKEGIDTNPFSDWFNELKSKKEFIRIQ